MVSTRNLALAAITLHGPIDIITTTAGIRFCGPDIEGNFLVHDLGFTRWTLLKGAALLGIPLVVSSVQPASGAAAQGMAARFAPSIVRGLLWVLVAIGVLLILPNIPILAACII